MLAVQNQIAYEHHQNMVGREFLVLCEGEAKIDREVSKDLVQLGRAESLDGNLTGRTDGDHIVHFRGPKSMIGSIAKIQVTEARALSLGGIIS